MQFAARERAYDSQYPRADRGILLEGDRPIGRIVADRGEAAITLVDIALLAERRNAGIGTALVQGLQAEAAAMGKPVRLQVLKSSRAARLYERLGFAVVGDSGVYLAMEWRAPPPRGAFRAPGARPFPPPPPGPPGAPPPLVPARSPAPRRGAFRLSFPLPR